MTAKIKLNAASGGGSISIQAPSSSSNNRVISLPDIADGTLVTSQSTLDATKLSGNLPAISGAALTGITAGITMADQWRITSTFQNSSNAYITSNWERNDTAGYAKIGTGMSESSGVFSFPETGIYLVGINITGNADSGGFNYVACSIYTTLNNSSYTQSASTYESVDASNRHWAMATEFLFDVTNVSNCKVKFFMSASNTNSYVYGDSSLNTTFAHFTRLGDT